jgi:hypothetical protein
MSDIEHVRNQFAAIGERLREDVDLLTAKMDRGELKPFEIRMLKMAVYMIQSEQPAIGDLTTGATIISALASHYPDDTTGRAMAMLEAVTGKKVNFVRVDTTDSDERPGNVIAFPEKTP